ncbi:MAG: formate--tetrahydrofolate ligase, partial [Deltaproteobacteria bacterium]|nr:formate--tetrahydrofolate ligase [Deltaproteobacteria bacterium]
MTLRPLSDVAAELGLSPDHLVPYGRDKAKVSLEALDAPAAGKGRLVLVSAINPTPAGEGKTTVSVGLGMGLGRIGRKTAIALREPSLGPVFGMKGGATGGGAAQVEPAESINLHFTGDLHAVGAAHNLLAALVDNDLHWGSAVGLDARKTTWGRAIDMNDRSLRTVLTGLGGEGVPRETRFDITAASEVMAILCLSTSIADLQERLGRIRVGRRADGTPVTASDLGAAAAMTALLREALLPNLVQSREGGAAFVHGGPFANIAHGCSSLVATRLAVRHADWTVTEAGFGFDLGGEKFLDIKCRLGGLWPDAVVLVATVRALTAHGGAGEPDRDALSRGLANLEHHAETARGLGLPVVVALNVFATDSEGDLRQVEDWCAERSLVCARIEAFARGGDGAVALAEAVVSAGGGTRPAPSFVYPLEA